MFSGLYHKSDTEIDEHGNAVKLVVLVDGVSHDSDVVPDSGTGIHDEVSPYPGVSQLQRGRDNEGFK